MKKNIAEKVLFGTKSWFSKRGIGLATCSCLLLSKKNGRFDFDLLGDGFSRTLGVRGYCVRVCVCVCVSVCACA